MGYGQFVAALCCQLQVRGGGRWRLSTQSAGSGSCQHAYEKLYLRPRWTELYIRFTLAFAEMGTQSSPSQSCYALSYLLLWQPLLPSPVIHAMAHPTLTSILGLSDV